MDSHRKMDVVDWQDTPQPTIPDRRRPPHYLPPTLVGILGTLLLHAVAIQSLPFGGQGSQVKSPEARDSRWSPTSTIIATESLMFVMLPAASDQIIAQSIPPLPDLSVMKIKTTVNLDPPAFTNMETLALEAKDPASELANAGADDAENAHLFGIYTGQIQARIQRVWRRPRTPVNAAGEVQLSASEAESFQCEAQIVQDSSGHVQEILLPRCNGSPAWQRSLVLAIQQASPLPAPPSERVFMRSITLQFLGFPFAQGNSSDEYEEPPRDLARANAQ